MDPVPELPSACEWPLIKAGHMSAPDYAPSSPKDSSCTEGGVHTCLGFIVDLGKARNATCTGFGVKVGGGSLETKECSARSETLTCTVCETKPPFSNVTD